MAAHVLTAFNQIRKYPHIEHIRSALNFSCWTEDLTLEDYCDLSDLVSVNNEPIDLDDLYQWIDSATGKYKAEWLELNQPATREEWRKAKYGGLK